MLLIDKYIVKNKEDIVFHKKIFADVLKYLLPEDKTKAELEFLHNRTKDNPLFPEYKKIFLSKTSFRTPNILINGYNKGTLVNMILKEIYGPDIEDLEYCSYKIIDYGNKERIIELQQSPFHIIIEPTKTAIDKYIIQSVIKDYAITQSGYLNKRNVNYKVVLINHAEDLSLYAQTCLRRTMEEYYRSCVFILCTNEINKIIQPLRSRCISIRLPKPTDIELLSYLYNVSKLEKIDITLSNLSYITKQSNRDVKLGLWWLEYYKNKIYAFMFSWKELITNLVDMLHYVYTSKKVLKESNVTNIRSIINNVLSTNITSSKLIYELLEQIIIKHKEYSNTFLKSITKTFYTFDCRLSKGTRSIIHIEALLMTLIYTFYSEKT